MIRWLRQHAESTGGEGPVGRVWLVGAIVLAVIVAFFLQMGMGVCPVY